MTTANNVFEILRVKTCRYLSPTKRNSGLPYKIAFVILQLTDFTVTRLAGSLGLHEFNPMMRDLVNSPFQLAVIKVFIPLTIAWLFPGKWLIPAIILLIIIVAFDGLQLAVYVHT